MALLLALVAAGALAFAWPWLPSSGAASTSLERYSPTRDGSAVLFAKVNQRDQTTSWQSQNQVVIAGARLFSDVRRALGGSILEHYGALEPGARMDDVIRRLGRLQVVETRVRELDAAGQVTETISTSVREARGELLFAITGAGDERDVVFSPPILTYPADPRADTTWESRGRYAGTADYLYTGRVIEAGPRRTPLGSFDDCLRIETRMTFSQAGRAVGSNATDKWYCAGVGLVEATELDESGEPLATGLAVASGAVRPPLGRLVQRRDLDQQVPPAATLAEQAEPGDPGEWQLSRVGRTRRAGDIAISTIAPLRVPTEPPVVLASGYGGDLLAFDAGAPDGTIVWRFHAGGTIYGPPGVDPATGRVYFGATDKRLYALDARSLFLWSFETGDSIASRPLVVNLPDLPHTEEEDLWPASVIFGSEDRHVYALHAATGELGWVAATGGPIASSPVLVGRAVVIGSDDGSVYAIVAATLHQALEPRSGDRLSGAFAQSA